MPRFLDEQIIKSGVGTADITTSAISFSLSYGFSVQWNISGTSPSGSAQVQASNDGVNWVAVSTIAVSVSGSFFDNKDAIYYKHLRLFWDFTSGSGIVVNAFLVTKGG